MSAAESDGMTNDLVVTTFSLDSTNSIFLPLVYQKA